MLAAGKGTRLSSVTATTPKSLIKVNGKSILEHAIELCRRHGITEFFINTHHHAEKITSSLGDGARFGVKITYSYEPELLGTAGAIRNFMGHLTHDPFFVLYGDNYSDYNLDSHRFISITKRWYGKNRTNLRSGNRSLVYIDRMPGHSSNFEIPVDFVCI